MNAPHERPTERDLHAMIDERLDRRRARQLETWLANEAGQDARLGAWKRGLDALRAAYDPILAETPPLHLSLAARASAVEAGIAPTKSIPTKSAATQQPAPARAPLHEASVAVTSFFVGAFAALMLSAAAQMAFDPAHPGIVEATRRILAQVGQLFARLLDLL